MGCKKTNWSENYKESEKSPFGTYIIYNEITNLIENTKIEYLNKNIYDYLYNYPFKERSANYICIKNSAYRINKNGISSLLKFVAEGNDAFLALNYFSSVLKDSLEISVKNLDSLADYNNNLLRDLSGKLSLENKSFKKNTFLYNRNLRKNYFTSFNKNKTIVLGTQKIDNENKPVFIKIYHGKGAFYLHLQPVAFTNYNLLKKENVAYAENVLSYLKDKKNSILWDPQIRKSKLTENKEEKKSILGFFLKHKALKWSLYISFLGLLMFILFNAKRKQRPIPIINKLTNSTIEFTHTISNLYLKENNPKNLIDKKIIFFLQKVRTLYLLETNNLNNEFIKKLSLKSGNDIRKTKYLINTIISLNNKQQCTKNELERLNILIENFFDNQ